MEMMQAARTLEVVLVGAGTVARRAMDAALAREPWRMRCRGVDAAGMTAVLSLSLPDVVVLDAGEVPNPSALLELRRCFPALPVVVVSVNHETALPLMDAGAVDFLLLPVHGSEGEIQEFSAELITRLKIAAMRPCPLPAVAAEGGLRLIGIFSAKGGPVGPACLIRQLPADCPPVLVVQDDAAAYASDFHRVLMEMTDRPIVPINASAPLNYGRVYLYTGHRAPRVTAAPGKVAVKLGLPTGRCVADGLFASMARALGTDCAGVLLAHPGRGGAEGLARLAHTGAWCARMDKNAILRDPQSVEPGAVRALPLEDIAVQLATRAAGAAEAVEQAI